MLELRPAAERGTANLGWLDARHTFSFGSYYDPRHSGFSDLVVINEDRIRPGAGFDTHGHRDMEIITYVLEGALAHRDSLGNGSVIRPGEVQVMSAGTGIRHSEYNASDTEPVHLLQIWILPDRREHTPRYEQRDFGHAPSGRLRLIVSPDGALGSLAIHQDARIYAGTFSGADRDRLSLPPDRDAYVQLARGTLTINGETLRAGDGARVRAEREIVCAGGEDAEVLIFDLRPEKR